MQEQTRKSSNRYGHFTRADNAHIKIRYVLKCPMEALLLAIMHQQTTSSVMRHLRTAKKITRIHPIGSEGFRSDSERVFRNVEFVCEKYYVYMLSTNVTQYLVFRPPEWSWWVYEWGAQVRKHKYRKSPHSKKPSSSKKITQPSHRIQLHLRNIFSKEPEIHFLFEISKTLKTKRPLRIAVHS
jgi:hypothetical protein